MLPDTATKWDRPALRICSMSISPRREVSPSRNPPSRARPLPDSGRRRWAIPERILAVVLPSHPLPVPAGRASITFPSHATRRPGDGGPSGCAVGSMTVATHQRVVRFQWATSPLSHPAGPSQSRRRPESSQATIRALTHPPSGVPPPSVRASTSKVTSPDGNCSRLIRSSRAPRSTPVSTPTAARARIRATSHLLATAAPASTARTIATDHGTHNPSATPNQIPPAPARKSRARRSGRRPIDSPRRSRGDRPASPRRCPGTSSRSSRTANGPFASLWVTMRVAITSPTPGSSVSCSTPAWFRSTGNTEDP